MRTVRVQPKDIYITTEFSFEELCLLRDGLNATELNLNLESEGDKQVEEFMTVTLYSYVTSLLRELET